MVQIQPTALSLLNALEDIHSLCAPPMFRGEGGRPGAPNFPKVSLVFVYHVLYTMSMKLTGIILLILIQIGPHQYVDPNSVAAVVIVNHYGFTSIRTSIELKNGNHIYTIWSVKRVIEALRRS